MTRATTAINLAARNLLGTDTSQFFLKIADLPKSCFLVESVSLQHWGFHQDFTIELNVLVLQELDDDVLLHAPASVQLQIDAERVTLNGLIIGDDCQIRVGANHSIHVQQDYRLQTEEGEIQMEAATDIVCTAGKAIRLHNTEQTIELSADQIVIKSNTVSNN
jgi:hypothetical protein